MANVTVFGGGYSGITGSVASGTNQYAPLGMWGKSSASGGLVSADTTEANVKQKVRHAGTASHLSAFLRLNTYTSTTSIRLRVNGANGNLVVSCTASTTGGFTDATHSDTLSSGDDINANWAPTGGSFNSFSIESLLLAFDGSGSNVTILSSGAQGAITTASVTRYFPVTGDFDQAGTDPSTETDYVKTDWFSAGTLSNLFIHAGTNTSTNAITAKGRVNSADGNQSVSIAGSTTGFFEDTTHTDTLASGDVINGSTTSGAGTVNLAYNIAGFHFTGSGTTVDIVAGHTANGATWSTSADSFHPPTGYIDTQANATTESGQKSYWPAVTKLTNLRVRVGAHSSNNNSPTFALRLNGSDGAQSVSITQNTTGLFRDSTHSDTTAIGDNVYFRQQHPGAGSLVLSKGGFTLDSTVASTETGTGGLDFSGIAFDATGTDIKGTGTGTLAFTGIAFAGTGADSHTGTGSLALSGIAFTGAGNDTHATGGLDFSGISFVATGSGPRVPRATQVVRFVMSETSADPRATQVARMIAAEVQAHGRSTQIARMLTVGVRVQARATQLARLIVAEAVPCTTQWCQLWTITRRDGVVLRFTSLDEDFDFGGDTFKSCGSLNPSAAESATSLGDVGNIELEGIVDDDGITEADLYGGLYDDAFVEVWLVPWNPDSDETARRLAAGWAGVVQHGEKGFNVEVVGPGARLGQQSLVQTVTPSCRWVFGDSRCGVDIEALKRSGTVITAIRRGSFFADLGGGSSGSSSSSSGSSSSTVPQFTNGRVRFLSGPNAGIVVEVKDVDFDAGEVTLWALPPFLPETGDAFDLLPGCAQDKATCQGVYGNYDRFGGFADVPGNDSLNETPDAKY